MSFYSKVASTFVKNNRTKFCINSIGFNSIQITNLFDKPRPVFFQRSWLSSYPPHEVVGMPSLSPTMEAGAIASWNVEVGDSFGAGDVLCEIETDKATVSFEAQDDGVIAKILADAGPTEINCGVPILVTVEDEDDVGAFQDFIADSSGTDAINESSPEPAQATIQTTASPNVNLKADVTSSPFDSASTVPNEGRVIASPLAWTTAKEKGLDLASIAILGTGPNGRIIADDVREFIPLSPAIESNEISTSQTPATLPFETDKYTDFPLDDSSMTIANQLVYSKQTIPHYYLTVDITLDSILNLRSSLNATLHDDTKITLNDLLIKASACAMKSCPSANASWMGDSVRMYKSVDVNVIMGNGDSLYAPVLQNVDSMGLKSISDELATNLKKIEEGTVDEKNFNAVGTVTVMNLGMYGIKSCAPIIRAPQAVALAFGAAENRVVPKELPEGDSDLYTTNVVLTATLSCDHRVVDGAVGAQFLSALKVAVENPESLLL